MKPNSPAPTMFQKATEMKKIEHQFQEMEDSDKLSSPTYEEMDSGIKLSDDDDEDDP